MLEVRKTPATIAQAARGVPLSRRERRGDVALAVIVAPSDPPLMMGDYVSGGLRASNREDRIGAELD